MPFTAECPFCRIMLDGVPDERNGASVECPRCRNLFTLAAMIQRRKARRKFVKALSESAGAHPAATAILDFQSKTPLTTIVGLAGSSAPPHAETSSPRTRAGAVNRLGVLAFFFGTFSLLFASLPDVNWLVLPMAGIGLVLAGLGLFVPSARRSGVGLPSAGLAVSLPVLLLAAFWPDALGLPIRAVEQKAPADTQTVYHFSKGGVQHIAPRASEWVDAGKDAVQQAGMRVRVAGVDVKSVELKDPQGRRQPGEICLFVRLRISNAGVDHLVEYKSWGELHDTGQQTKPKLTDDSGKEYRLKDFGSGWTVAGHVPKASLPTAKWVDDVLVFHAPSARIHYLRLELPGAAIGVSNKFQIEIPRRMISFP